MIVRLHIVYLFVSLFIVCSKSCISLNSGECSLGRTFFGGRLVLTGNDGLGDISQQFIFVTPFGFNSYLKSPRGFGRGRIWVGKRNCLGYGTQSQDYCPLADSRPCLDKTVPCFSMPPSYMQSEPLEFSNVTDDSVTVSWPAWNEATDLGVGPVSHYKLQYREEGATFNETLLDANTLFYQFSGLKIGTTYEFRIILIRGLPFIESEPSSIQNVTTLNGAPPSYNSSRPLQFSSVTEDGITVTWPAWSEITDYGVGPVSQYRIQYREEEGGTFKDKLLDAHILSQRFDGLEEGKKYEFRIILIREQPPTDGQPSPTQSSTPCGDMGELNLGLTTQSRSIGKARIVARWQIRTLPEFCEVSQQSITIHQLNDDNCTLPTPAVDKTNSLKTSQRQKTFQRLDANWNFNITLQVTHPSGVYTSSKVQRTAETRPEAPPSNVRPIQKDNGWKGFRWEEPPCHLSHGEIVKYGYTIQKNDEPSAYYTTDKTFVLFNNLQSGNEYNFQVRAWTLRGSGPFSEIVTLTT